MPGKVVLSVSDFRGTHFSLKSLLSLAPPPFQQASVSKRGPGLLLCSWRQIGLGFLTWRHMVQYLDWDRVHIARSDFLSGIFEDSLQGPKRVIRETQLLTSAPASG